ILGGTLIHNQRGQFYQIQQTEYNPHSRLAKLQRELDASRSYISTHLHLCNYQNNLLFLDIETVGLSPTSPLLLIGILSFHPPRSCKFIARTPKEEPAVLQAFVSALTHHLIVTFNGHQFDWPYILKRNQRHK